MTIIAFPQSKYHLELLIQNNINVDIFVTNNEKLKECLTEQNIFFFENEIFKKNISHSFKHNRQLLSTLKKLILSFKNPIVILFADNKPHQKFLIDLCLKNNLVIELWEDGLGYYIGSGNIFKYIIKNFIKIYFGSYCQGWYLEQYKRNNIILKDRFIHGNLIYSRPLSRSIKTFDRIAFISQPLVEDGYIKEDLFIKKIEELALLFNKDIDYFPHPREKYKEFSERVNIMKGINTEEFLGENKYIVCISAFSTVIVNLPNFQKKLFYPLLFDLKNIHRKLIKCNFADIEIIDQNTNINIIIKEK